MNSKVCIINGVIKIYLQNVLVYSLEIQRLSL